MSKAALSIAASHLSYPARRTSHHSQRSISSHSKLAGGNHHTHSHHSHSHHHSHSVGRHSLGHHSLGHLSLGHHSLSHHHSTHSHGHDHPHRPSSQHSSHSSGSRGRGHLPDFSPSNHRVSGNGTLPDELYDAEVEYYQRTMNIKFIWIFIFVQLSLWILDVIFVIAWDVLYFNDDQNPDLKRSRAFIIGCVSVPIFLAAVGILVHSLTNGPKGCSMGTGIGFQVASDVIAAILFYQLYQDYMKRITSIDKNEQSGFLKIAIIIALLSSLYILVSSFVLTFLYAGACCGTLQPPYKEIYEGQELPLSKRMINIMLLVEMVSDALLLLVALVAAEAGSKPTVFFAGVIQAALFGFAIFITLAALESPTGITVGLSLILQVTVATVSSISAMGIVSAISCSQNIDIICPEPISNPSTANIAEVAVVLVVYLGLVIPSIFISLQFCSISCCGRYKINQGGFCDVQEVVPHSHYEPSCCF